MIRDRFHNRLSVISEQKVAIQTVYSRRSLEVGCVTDEVCDINMIVTSRAFIRHDV